MTEGEAGPVHRVTVRIAGEEIALRSSVEPEHARRCAEYLDERVRELSRAAGVPPARALVLAALSITDARLRAEEELDRFRKEVASRSANLARRVEEALDRP